MNQTETKAYDWLQKQKQYKAWQITFREAKSPDFITDDGKGWEVKRIAGGTITFYAPTQVESVNNGKTTILAFRDGDTVPQVFAAKELSGRPRKLHGLTLKYVDTSELKQVVKIESSTMGLVRGIKAENPELDSMDDAVRLAAQVYVLAKQAGVLVITGGFPLIRRPQIAT